MALPQDLQAGVIRLKFRMAIGPMIEASEEGLDYLWRYLVRIRDSFADAPDDVVIQAVSKHVSINAFIYDRAASLASDDLESGDHHLYRGVLDPDGDGPEILATYEHCVDKLEEQGAINHEQGDYMKGYMRGRVLYCVG